MEMNKPGSMQELNERARQMTIEDLDFASRLVEEKYGMRNMDAVTVVGIAQAVATNRQTLQQKIAQDAALQAQEEAQARLLDQLGV